MSSKQSVHRGLSRGKTRKGLPQKRRPCNPPQGPCCSKTRSSEITEATLAHLMLRASQSAAAVCNNPPKPAQGAHPRPTSSEQFPRRQRHTAADRERTAHPPQPESSRDTAADLTSLPPPPSDCDCRLLTGSRSINWVFLQPERSGSGPAIETREKVGLDSFLVPFRSR